MNQYAHFIGRSITQNYEPDAWFSTFRGDKYHYMWGALYQSELEFPDWGNADFNGARIQGMRYFTRRCVAGSGTPPPPPIGTRTRPGLACYGGAVYPDSWRSEAGCNAFGCNFGRMDLQACLALGAAKGSREVIHGNPGGGRSNECWLQQSCADLRPNGDFTLFRR